MPTLLDAAPPLFFELSSQNAQPADEQKPFADPFNPESLKGVTDNLGDQLRQNFSEQLFWGMYGGMILVLLVYILTLGVLTQPKILFCYGLKATTLFVLMFIYLGYGAFLPFPPQFMTQVVLALFPLWIFSSILFSQLYLDTRNTLPGLHKWLWIPFFSSVGLVLSVQSGWNGYPQDPIAVWWNLTLVLHIGLLVGAGILALRRGVTDVGFYLAGHGLTLFVAGLLLFAGANWADKFTSAGVLLPLVVLFEMILLATSFARRLAQTRREHDARENMVRDQRRFSAFGQNVKATQEQWDRPLIQLREILDEADERLSGASPHHPDTDLDYLRQSLMPRLENNLREINRTVNDVRDLLVNAPTEQRSVHD
ncbi:7TM-DISM domain-containing protein [Geoalkalibacter halelectricus]|nr:7TM-DISM domain-containing protein [Geoalkalibacter halelectricus]